uniref:Uncharacterized protein n=1 Tax=Arundo donax TaxID=35708 RepID=A0A0A9HB03_ARUDO
MKLNKASCFCPSQPLLLHQRSYPLHILPSSSISIHGGQNNITARVVMFQLEYLFRCIFCYIYIIPVSACSQ